MVLFEVPSKHSPSEIKKYPEKQSVLLVAELELGCLCSATSRRLEVRDIIHLTSEVVQLTFVDIIILRHCSHT